MDLFKPIAIVGGGLAGSFLAARLSSYGHAVALFDDPQPNSASRIAAGMFNVITGRFGAKSWEADRLLEELRSFFFDDPLFFSLQPFLHYAQIYRPFKTVEEYNKWLSRAHEPAFAHLVEREEEPLFPGQIENPWGGIRIIPCGWAETDRILDGILDILRTQPDFSYFQQRVTAGQIDLDRKIIATRTGELEFEQIVFCEGPQAKDNPFFSHLPIIPNKGEILLIEAPELELPFLLSKKVYLIPQGQDRFIVGSTYQNQFEHAEPTEAGKAEICSYLDKALKVPYTVIDHKAGIRPTTSDRRPIVARHPEHDFMHFLGGFGTKGMLAGPYCARLLADYLDTGNWTVPPEVDGARFGSA
ncbi:MAG: FAD-binding oxidoreductase [Bacteroidota bacterium]